MKILKKLSAIAAVLAVMPLMSANVFADMFDDNTLEDDGEVVYEAGEYVEPDDVYECTAEDGSKFYLYFDKESGEYDGYEAEYGEFDYAIDNINQTVTFLEVETGYALYSDPAEIPLAEGEILVELPFERHIEITDMLLCVVSGTKYYVVTVGGADSKVRYMGHSAEYRYIEDAYECDEQEEQESGWIPRNWTGCNVTAEDGMRFGLIFKPAENGELEYIDWEAEEVVSDEDYAYSVDENSRIIISSITVGEIDTGYTLYSDPAEIPLADNEVLAEVDNYQYIEDDLGRLAALLEIKKYYVITVDGMDSTVRCAGCSYNAVDMYSDFEPSPDSNWLDGTTTSPKTGSGGNYFAVMLTAAAIGAVAKKCKMC